MRTYASSIASKAIESHMHGKIFDYVNESNYQIGMYSKRLNLLYGDGVEGVDFNNTIYQKDNALYVIDRSAHLHLGIDYIVLKNTNLFKQIDELKKDVILYTFFALILVGVIGYFLSRLFLKPIAREREKLDKFIKDTTHELNTPISALLMSLSSLKGEDKKVSERIRLSIHRISNIYDDLCYLLKDDIKKTTAMDMEELNLKDIIEEQLVLFALYAKSKKIELHSILEDTSIMMESESAKRLINNIISNALKYSKPDSRVDIILKNKELKVIDQGVGIEKEDLKNIKDRYFRANKSEGGFGIGLDIVNSICKKYKITFTIESKKDQGTMVCLTFFTP